MDSWATSQSSRNKLANMTPCNNQSTIMLSNRPAWNRACCRPHSRWPNSNLKRLQWRQEWQFYDRIPKKGKVLVMVFRKNNGLQIWQFWGIQIFGTNKYQVVCYLIIAWYDEFHTPTKSHRNMLNLYQIPLKSGRNLFNPYQIPL